MSLPVESISCELLSALKRHNVILVAPPGAGKSTCLPLKLLEHPPLSGQRIIMLQPRRVAVRAIAHYLASQLGEKVGETVGYRIRGEQQISHHTRLEIVTEGLLTRKLQHDPALAGVGVLIFDEFHERNLHSDFSLALAIEAQQGLREDLRLLIMSATLDVSPITTLLPDATLLHSVGRSFPVDVRYRPFPSARPLVTQVVTVILEALDENSGNVLVFLPGVRSIHETEVRLRPRLAAEVQIAPLHGSLAKHQQQGALSPAPEGQRKVILATNIAETSLTIDGISVVVDSGLENNAQFELRRGITQLRQQRICQASATQRAGRAGRIGPGVCYRLWGEEAHGRLPKHAVPQILQADIAPLLLEALSWGEELANLPLLDMPTVAQCQQGETLLQQLQVLDKQGKLSAHGRAVARLGCHPRLANILVHAKRRAAPYPMLACYVVALLESSELRQRGAADIYARLKVIMSQSTHPLEKQARQWANRLALSPQNTIQFSPLMVAELLLYGYPDFVGKARGQGRFLLANGTGASVPEEATLSHAKWLVAADVMLTRGADAKINLGEQLSKESLTRQLAHCLVQDERCEWHDLQQRIVASRRTMLGAIEISTAISHQPDETQCIAVWQALLQQQGLKLLGEQPALRLFLQRLYLAARHVKDQWQEWNERHLLGKAEQWFSPYVSTITTLAALQKVDWLAAVQALFSWQELQSLEALLPTRLAIPSGRSVPLDYREHDKVVVSVKIQEMFGLGKTPTIANGSIPVTVELLSPAMRPIQTTQDLGGFWHGSYKEVQKEMKGRYPKHFWPDDPATAEALVRSTRKSKPSL